MSDDSERFAKDIAALIKQLEQENSDRRGAFQAYIDEARLRGVTQSRLIARRVLDACPDSRLAELFANGIYREDVF